MLKLVELIGEGLDLLHLIVDHFDPSSVAGLQKVDTCSVTPLRRMSQHSEALLRRVDVFRDFLRCVQDGLRMESRIVNDPLGAGRCRDADCQEGECDELFHGILSLRAITFSGDTPPITGDELPRVKGAKMYVIHKMQRSPRQWKGNGHEDTQSPRAGLPTAMFAVFVCITRVDTNGHASIFQDLEHCCEAPCAGSATTAHAELQPVLFDETSRVVETGLGPQNAEKS
jgi:hypothetical protein